MARIYITREGDGTYTVRGTRFEGKSLAAREVSRKVARADVGVAAGNIMKKMGNRGDKKLETLGTAGEREIT